MKRNEFIALALLCTMSMAAPAQAGTWLQEGTTWMYQKDQGQMAAGEWVQDTDQRWYYFDQNGRMLRNSMTPDGYVLGADGAYIPGMGQDQDSALSPWAYQQLLGRGMDVDWSKTSKGRSLYQTKVVEDFKSAGVDHVRIRVKDTLTQEQLLILKRQITDCLNHGIIPILAYQADAFKKQPNQETMQGVVNWWRTMATYFQSTSHLLAFDLMIECTEELNKHPDILNQMIEQTVTAIRETNPDRIIMMSPRVRSAPEYLSELQVPTKGNGYMMAEWHFYASGPSKTNPKKLWTTGTAEEQQLIWQKIQYALQWQQQTGIPTWVGAWMAGDYNKDNQYTLAEQIQFASFVCQALDAAGIPFAVNADAHFYNREAGTWYAEMAPLRQLIWGN